MTNIDDIARILSRHEPLLLDADERIQAAVAFIIREERDGIRVLFVERAARAGDPWSGDIGFPGGRVEESDGDPRHAAEREAREEIDLDLDGARYLGRLSDIVGAHLPVQVACFVYGVEDPPPLRLSDELRDAFWVPLAELTAPQRHVMAEVGFGGETFERPAIRLPATGKPVLWGITYRLVMEFLRLLEGEGDDQPHGGER